MKSQRFEESVLYTPSAAVVIYPKLQHSTPSHGAGFGPNLSKALRGAKAPAAERTRLGMMARKSNLQSVIKDKSRDRRIQ
ncbi:hypothetical protein PGT21_010827 [Puccinia graminis f. sp. tritici]|uniref:Uncharacterized protein n=1 Tax=Puccinia graminis f. sp. tritici TaxID=56615 RepID=A0A5B0P9V0_PUCGR|nr:hypothetical protein PGTUg99_033047 [Puccinia graminis f. sp. tritici]KAA1097552.1 hypothetical protein PGT21_011150 [Puccinia graminis f. sp. tritici]KAA1101200.1 hypothetical protein PGT21_010827 [Puccinia graminis f. sp. tritici]KAA1134072.1 hypothetical protein PGTUg99_024185 [Puccinia graminis f. sp. tritici]